MQNIGFVQRKKVELPKLDNCLLSFDSGNGIDFSDACFHTIVLGTTGSGKTTNVVLPALSSFLKQNFCGLIIDVKGNLREKVHALAKEHKREEDIIEFGTSQSAMPLNLLKGLSRNEIFEYLKTLTTQSFDNRSLNLDFHIRGVQQLTDCAELLQLISEKYKVCSCNLKYLLDMLNDYSLAQSLYKFFKEVVYDEKNLQHQQLVNLVDSNNFHVLHFGALDLSIKDAKTYHTQLNFELSGPKIALQEFVQVPGIANAFANPEGDKIEMVEMLLKNKIVLLRFDVESGSVGAKLSRLLIEEYYKAIYMLGVEIASQHPSFICLDEFQEVADLSENRFSDMKFISQAREFKASFFASTQSLAAINIHYNSHVRVAAFVTNCNNRIFFYSDDIYTGEYANFKLTNLSASKAYVQRYIASSRMRVEAVESFQNIYDKTQEILLRNKEGTPTVKENFQKDEILPLQQIANLYLIPVMRDKLQSDEKKAKLEQNKQEKRRKAMEKKTNNLNNKKNTIMSIDEANLEISNSYEESAESIDEISSSFIRKMLEEFPEYFVHAKPNKLIVPFGWQKRVVESLRAIKKLEMKLDIESFSLAHQWLEASVHYNRNGFVIITDSQKLALVTFNEFLSSTINICSCCGKKNGLEEKLIGRRHINICSDCMELGHEENQNESMETI